jgi:Domain of unknown function (DUF4286)
MVIYNITVGVDAGIEQEWLSWIEREHIPEIMGTGLFLNHKIYKVLHENPDGTISFCLQFFASSLDLAVRYLEDFAPTHAELQRIRFADRHVAFRTLLEEL